jgi:putative dimethyl sulfoxide reductase chaperone
VLLYWTLMALQDTSIDGPVDPDTSEGLARSLAFFCELFWGPSPELCTELFDPGLDALSRSTARWPDLSRGLASMAEFCSTIGDRPAFCQDLESAYVALFVSGMGGVPAPPYASCHIDGDEFMGEASSRMRRRLAESGLAPAVAGEPPDHLAIELEYLYFLLTTEPPNAAAFAREEMLPWAGRLSDKVTAAEDGSPERRFWSLAGACLVPLLEVIETLRT